MIQPVSERKVCSDANSWNLISGRRRSWLSFSFPPSPPSDAVDDFGSDEEDNDFGEEEEEDGGSDYEEKRGKKGKKPKVEKPTKRTPKRKRAAGNNEVTWTVEYLEYMWCGDVSHLYQYIKYYNLDC